MGWSGTYPSPPVNRSGRPGTGRPYAALSSSRVFEACIAARAQFASRTGSATVSPIVQGIAPAQVASVGVVADQVDQRRTAQCLRQFPVSRLVDPHQGRFDPEVG